MSFPLLNIYCNDTTFHFYSLKLKEKSLFFIFWSLSKLCQIHFCNNSSFFFFIFLFLCFIPLCIFLLLYHYFNFGVFILLFFSYLKCFFFTLFLAQRVHSFLPSFFRVPFILYMVSRGGSRRVEKFLQESILIAFDFIWKVLHSTRKFATLLDPPMVSFFYKIYKLNHTI